MLLAMTAAGAEAADAHAAVVSLVGFIVGAALAGRLPRERNSGGLGGRGLRTVLWFVVALIAIGAVISSLTDLPPAWTIGPIAVAMGMQATLAMRIALPYLTTGFITGTIVNASMRSPVGDRSEPRWWYAAITVAAIGSGAALGTLVARATIAGALVLLGGAVVVAASIASRRRALGQAT